MPVQLFVKLSDPNLIIEARHFYLGVELIQFCPVISSQIDLSLKKHVWVIEAHSNTVENNDCLSLNY
jgi:hypothetical protein